MSLKFISKNCFIKRKCVHKDGGLIPVVGVPELNGIRSSSPEEESSPSISIMIVVGGGGGMGRKRENEL